MRRSAALALALALATSGATPARPATCQPHLLGADRRGPAHALARSGTMVYLGAGAALVVIDAADPENPVERGYANLGGVVRDVASWGWTAIALEPEAIEFVDANDPTHPQVVGSFALAPEWDVRTLDARDSMVFFTAPDGLHIVSFTDAAAPEEIGVFVIAEASDVAAWSGRAYLLAGSALHVLDTTDPTSPAEIAQVPTLNETYQNLVVAPSGTRLATWVAYSDGRHCGGSVGFFDLTDPDLPVWRSSLYYDDPSCPQVVALGGGRAYVGFWSEVEIFDLGNLPQPELRGILDVTSAEQILVATPADYLLAAGPFGGFTVFDVATPQSAHEVAAVGMPRPTSDGFFSGSLVVTVNEAGVRVSEIEDPTRPLLIGELEVSGDPDFERILRVGSRAFATSSHDIRGFDLSDPTQPREVEPLASSGLLPPVLDHAHLFAESQTGPGLDIYDVSDPTAPVLVGEIGLAASRTLSDFTARLDRLYVWDYETDLRYENLRIYDVGEPATPVEIASPSMHFLHFARSVVHGDFLYLADESDLRVLRMTYPEYPALVADLSLPTGNRFKRRLDLYGSQLLIAPDRNERYSGWFDDRPLVFDVSDPLHPGQVLALDTPGDGRGAFAGPGLIGVADGEAGFSLYDSCVPFADGFESGDASAWSVVQP